MFVGNEKGRVLFFLPPSFSSLLQPLTAQVDIAGNWFWWRLEGPLVMTPEMVWREKESEEACAIVAG